MYLNENIYRCICIEIKITINLRINLLQHLYIAVFFEENLSWTSDTVQSEYSGFPSQFYHVMQLCLEIGDQVDHKRDFCGMTRRRNHIQLSPGFSEATPPSVIGNFSINLLQLYYK